MTTIPNLTDDQWQDVVERLALHAHYKLSRLYWRGAPPSRGGNVPGGVEPADLAADAVLALIEGKRTWNQQEEPDLVGFLKSVVDSMVSHLVESVENRVTRRLELSARNDSGELTLEVPGKEPDPLTVSANEEERERFRSLVLKEIEDDSLVEGVFDCLDAGITKPAEMAELLSKTIKDINNAQKRLRRKIESALKTHKKR